jgi:hypothetical protein
MSSQEVAKDQRWDCLDPQYEDFSQDTVKNAAIKAVADSVELEMPLLPHEEMDGMGG